MTSPYKQSPLLEVPPQQPGSITAASQLFSCAWLPMSRLARDSYSLLLLPRSCCGLQGVGPASSCPELDPDLAGTLNLPSHSTHPEQLLTSRHLQTLSNQVQMASTVKLKVKTMAPATYDLEAPSNVRHVQGTDLAMGLRPGRRGSCYGTMQLTGPSSRQYWLLPSKCIRKTVHAQDWLP